MEELERERESGREGWGVPLKLLKTVLLGLIRGHLPLRPLAFIMSALALSSALSPSRHMAAHLKARPTHPPRGQLRICLGHRCAVLMAL